MEKLKAKEEAEDLAQEMAELRYQITGLLEEECKRRASIEQAALQRIAELEALVSDKKLVFSFILTNLSMVNGFYLFNFFNQLQRDQGKPLITIRHLPEV